MSAASDELYRRIANHYFTSTDHWDPVNQTLPGGQQLESVVTEMATNNFGGGFNKSTTLTIGTALYYCTIRPPQNKFDRGKKSYADRHHEGASSYCNILVYRAQTGHANYRGETAPVLNIHILLRTLKAEQRILKRAKGRRKDADGWQTVY